MEDDESLKLPLEQQWTHAKWSTRVHAYKAVAEQFAAAAPGDACFSAWAPRLKTAAADSNVIAMESGLRTVAAYAQTAAPAEVEAIRPAILAAAAEKALGAAKPSMKSTFQSLCADLVAGSATPAAIVEELIFTLKIKSPKGLAAAILNLRQLFVEFGKVMPLKPVLGALPGLFGQTDRNVRAESTNLAIVLAQVAGQPVVEAALQGIKPVQLKELLPKLQAAEPIKPLQVPRVMQAAAAAAAAEAALDTPGLAEEADLDPYDMADEISLKSKLPDISQAVASVKWKERKEALESVEIKFNGVVRIAQDDFGALAAQLAKVIQKDANLMCVTSAMNTVRMLAQGLRSKFQYTSTLLPPVMERFKEKKAGVLEASVAAASAIYRAVGLDALLPNICASLAHKVPQARVETSKFVLHILSDLPAPPAPAQVKELAPAVLKNMSDSQEPVRAEAAKILAALVKLVDKAMNPTLAQLDDLRKQKVADAAELVSVRARRGAPVREPAREPAREPVREPVREREAPKPRPRPAAPAPAPASPVRARSPVRPPGHPSAHPPGAAAPKQPRPLHTTDFTPIKPSSEASRRRLGSPTRPVPQAESSPESRQSPTRGPLATIETDMLKREKLLAVKERDMIQRQLDQERVLRESAERQVMALREEVDRLKRELNSKSANTSADGSLDNLNQRISTMNIRERDDSFERLSSRPITLGAPRVISRLNHLEDQQRAGQVEKSHENWRRAKEVTSELRKRVEEMKRTRMLNQGE